TPLLRHLDRLDTHKFRFEFRVAIFEEHLNDFLKIPPQLVEAFSLTVGTRPARDGAHVEARVGISLNYDVESAHRSNSFRSILLCRLAESYPLSAQRSR